MQAGRFPPQDFTVKSAVLKSVTGGQPYCEHLTNHLNDLVNDRRG
jgi:hypothetical protein